MTTPWRRIAVLGVGARGDWWAQAITKRLGNAVEIAAVCDRNDGRVRQAVTALTALGQKPAAYADLVKMLAEVKPQAVLVATPDHAHAAAAITILRAGIDIILEKPIACSAADCRAILAARKESGRRVVVGFNARWAPIFTQVKDLLLSGEIGEPVAVDLQWLLDTSHGADYFRRWHRNLANSGGLLVHKATHHFDLVNWFLASTPTAVFARGARRFYTPENAKAYGLEDRGERCLDCKAAAKCPYKIDLAATQHLRSMYLENEKLDGYQRDRCIFSSEIDIPDTISLSARYASGAMLTYSLQAFSPWEGLNLAIDGTRGRIEFHESAAGTRTRILPLGKPARDLEVWKGDGQHGGGDDRLIDALFGPPQPPDKWARTADERAGAWSALIGIAANTSILEGREIRMAELAPELAAEAANAQPARAAG